MADDLDRQEEGGQRRDGAGEMFEIPQGALRLHALPVIIDEDGQGAASGDVQLAGRRHKPGDQADHVGTENEEADRADHGQVLLPALADDVREEALECLEDRLEEALPAGRDEGELPGRQAEQDDEEEGHNDDHDDVIRDRAVGVLGFNAQEAEQGQDGLAEELVKEVGDVNAVL